MAEMKAGFAAGLLKGALEAAKKNAAGQFELASFAYIGEIGRATGDHEKDSARLVQFLSGFQCFERYPFLAFLPDENIVRTREGDELFIFIPADLHYRTAVNQLNAQGGIHDILYLGGGEPFILICKAKKGAPDSSVTIVSTAGEELTFKPVYDLNENPAQLVRDDPRLSDITVRGVG